MAITSMHRRPVAGAIVNAMSVDVEEHFQVSAFESSIRRDEWGSFESRVRPNTERLLAIFEEAGVRATFFILGWIADRDPVLVRSIVQGGHEVASHGYEHRLVYKMSPEAFRQDLRRARLALEAAGGMPVLGYRAPSYSVTRQSMWALDVLAEEGYVYDASIYPIRHDRYGVPDWPRYMTRVETGTGHLWEVPGSTVRLAGVNMPVGGGGYFRLLPYPWTRFGLRDINERERRPAVFYLHPWEIDPEQPRLQGSPLARIRHYRNLHLTEPRLRRLLREFRFGRICDVLLPPVAPPAGTIGTIDCLPALG